MNFSEKFVKFYDYVTYLLFHFHSYFFFTALKIFLKMSDVVTFDVNKIDAFFSAFDDIL